MQTHESNTIVLAKKQTMYAASGTGQTSRVDAQNPVAIRQGPIPLNFDLNGAVLASDAFFLYGLW